MRKLSATSKAGRQKNDLWGPSGTPLSVLRVNQSRDLLAAIFLKKILDCRRVSSVAKSINRDNNSDSGFCYLKKYNYYRCYLKKYNYYRSLN